MKDEFTLAALQRHAAREALRRRRQQAQRDDLLEAARALLPDHGLTLSYPRFAVEANVPRHTAAGLYNGTGDLAAAFVRREIYRLIEQTAPTKGASPADFLTQLIEAMRAAPEPHRVLRAMECGLPPRLLAAARETDVLLARAVGIGLSEVWPAPPPHAAPAPPPRAVPAPPPHAVPAPPAHAAPAPPAHAAPAIPPHAAEDIGRRALALLREAACAPHAPPARAEAALIVEMLAPAVASCAARGRTDAATPARRAANDIARAPDPALPDPALPDPALPDPALPDPALPHPTLPDLSWAARQAVGAGRPHPPDPPEWRGTLHPASLVALRVAGPPAPAHYPAGAG
jgi:WAS/WASL-interacting protein